MKYIMISVIDKMGMEREYPIIFPEALVHSDVYEAISNMLTSDKQVDQINVVSAGFLNSLGIQTPVSGKSESLGGLKCRDSDTAAIQFIDYTHGLHDPFVLELLSKRVNELDKKNG